LVVKAVGKGVPLAPRNRARLWLQTLLCLLGVGLVLAPAAAASNQIVQNPQPLESGCPKGAGRPPAPGSHCVPVPVSMIQDESSGPTGCGQSVFMQVPLLKGIVEYGALWTNINKGATPWLFTATGGRNGSGSGPYGEEYYSTKQVESPGGTIYKVPRGYGAWFVSAGGGPAPCDFRSSTAVAWGWTARYAVSGKLTVAGSGGGPAPKIRVQASCASGGTTTTDANGNYEFLLDRGPCTFAPQLKGGLTSTPRLRSLNVTHNIRNVDFQVPCDALTGTAKDVASAAAASPCKLLVYVKQLEPLRSGLAYHSDPWTTYPVDFVGKSQTALPGGRGAICESGCTDLRITVKDGQYPNDPVPGALVNAHVGLAEPRVAGDGSLCLSDAHGLTDTSVPCSRFLSDLTTDSNGQVYVRYWAPGVVSTATTTLNVTAKSTCTTSSCPLHTKQGSAKPTHLTINKYLIYKNTSPILTETEDEILADWTGFGENRLISFLLRSAKANTAAQLALKWLGAEETAEEAFTKALEFTEHAELVFLPVEAYEYWNSATERAALLAEFLKLNHLSAYGLGGPPSEAAVYVAPAFSFDQKLVDYGNFVPFHLLGTSGAWWDLAETIGRAYHYEAKHGNASKLRVSIELQVYETSYCDPSKGVCDPGYANDPGSASVLRPGIQPQLTFRLILRQKGLGVVDERVFDTPYDAIAWSETQSHLNDVIKDGKPH